MTITAKPFIRFFQLSLLFLLFSYCGQTDRHEAEKQPPSIFYLALGDSYTIGTGIDITNNWPNQLSDSLSSRGLQVDTTEIIAANGWTTSDLRAGITEQDPDSGFNLVSLLIGVNNQYQGLDIELYRTELRVLLEQAVTFAGGNSNRVFVISIPDYGVTPFAESQNPAQISDELDVYNEIAENISAEYGIPFVNITPVSKRAADDPSLLAPDQLHPSVKMYALWVAEILPTVTEMTK